MNLEKIPEYKKRIKEVTWWHKFDFGNGLVTNGPDFTQNKLKSLNLPESFEGKTVLDIGAWDGFFSFEAEKRGAEKVLAIDTLTWQEDKLWDVTQSKYVPHTKKAGFDLAHEILDSKVESKEIEVADITVDTVGKWDVVLYLGIFYHMKDPFKIIRNLFDVTKETLILETQTDLNILNQPAMAFYPNLECNNDVSNWWGPNVACVGQMLKLGFKEVKLVAASGSRAVFHAHK